MPLREAQAPKQADAMADEEVFELTEDGVFEIPSPTRPKASAFPVAEEEEEEEEVYPDVILSSSAQDQAAAAVRLDDIAEGEYKVLQEESEGKRLLHVIINVAKDQGDAQSVEWQGHNKQLTVTTSAGLKIPIDLSNASFGNGAVVPSKCTARRHEQFLVVVIPLA